MNNPEQNCQQIIELLDAYHDEELLFTQKNEVENHLAHCAECQKQLESLQNLVRGIKAIRPVQASRDFASSIDFSKPSITPGVDMQPGKAKVVNLPAKTWALTSIAAAIALIMIISGHQPTQTPHIALEQNNQQPIAPTVIAESPKQNIPSKNIETAPEVVAVTATVKHEPSGIKPKRRDSNNIPEKPAESIDSAKEFIGEREEIASVPEIGNLSSTEALGIATDEDGLYEIKI